MKTINTKYYTEWEALSRTNRCLMVAALTILIFIGLFVAFIGITRSMRVLMIIGAVLVLGGCTMSYKIHDMHERDSKYIKEKVFWMPNTANLDRPEFQEKWLVVAHDDCRRYYVVPRHRTDNGETFNYGN